ncbi:SGNH/GDSL hydrolase family protein [Nocardioides sp. MH1]|uniref:SGNH/GDSL hydrolase family protein n=1 Tax=Nocardioides sp. MH1 TaxID=3242490 RepID=UPI003521FBE9
MKPRSALVIALLAVATALTGCKDDPGPPATPDWKYQVHVGDQYVALGDSYTSAPRTGHKAPDSGECQNTVVNYPHRIARATGADLVDNSCSGATTGTLKRQQLDVGHPPQLADVDEDTALITFRLGANDKSLYAHIIQCSLLSLTDKEGDPCTELDKDQGKKRLAVIIPEAQDAIEKALVTVRERAPEARIVVISYPRVAPDKGSCKKFPLPHGDYAYARRIIKGVNKGLEKGAEKIDATYIDMYAASKGHDVCSKHPWVAGFPRPKSGDAAAWHPYPVEGKEVAKLVLAAIRS